jgi:hypothetical protein
LPPFPPEPFPPGPFGAFGFRFPLFSFGSSSVLSVLFLQPVGLPRPLINSGGPSSRTSF